MFGQPRSQATGPGNEASDWVNVGAYTCLFNKLFEDDKTGLFVSGICLHGDHISTYCTINTCILQRTNYKMMLTSKSPFETGTAHYMYHTGTLLHQIPRSQAHVPLSVARKNAKCLVCFLTCVTSRVERW